MEQSNIVSPQSSTTNINPEHNSPSKLPLAVGLIILLFLFGAGGYFLGQKSQSNKMTTTVPTIMPTEMITPTPQITTPTSMNWKSHTDSTYSFQYPSDWIVNVKDDAYFGYEANISNPSGTVVLRVLSNQQPYGFSSGSDLESKDISVEMNGETYQTVEYSSNRKAFVDFNVKTRHSDYQVLFGTGYPVGDDSNVSLNDYLASKDTILKILSSFKILID